MQREQSCVPATTDSWKSATESLVAVESTAADEYARVGIHPGNVSIPRSSIRIFLTM